VVLVAGSALPCKRTAKQPVRPLEGTPAMRKRVAFALSGSALALISVGPAAADNVLRFTGAAGGAVTMDPYSLWYNANRVAAQEVYEALLDIDSHLLIIPQLALAWKLLNTTTREFELRRDVRFHDGTPFTADDVGFSIERAGAALPRLRALESRVAAGGRVGGDRACVGLPRSAPV
jgi:peptide/nickel transport system substrate-binding protein